MSTHFLCLNDFITSLTKQLETIESKTMDYNFLWTDIINNHGNIQYIMYIVTCIIFRTKANVSQTLVNSRYSFPSKAS